MLLVLRSSFSRRDLKGKKYKATPSYWSTYGTFASATELHVLLSQIDHEVSKMILCSFYLFNSNAQYLKIQVKFRNMCEFRCSRVAQERDYSATGLCWIGLYPDLYDRFEGYQVWSKVVMWSILHINWNLVTEDKYDRFIIVNLTILACQRWRTSFLCKIIMLDLSSILLQFYGCVDNIVNITCNLFKYDSVRSNLTWTNHGYHNRAFVTCRTPKYICRALCSDNSLT